MLDRGYLRDKEKLAEYERALQNRRAPTDTLARFTELEEQRRFLIRDIEEKKAKRNEISKEIAAWKKEGRDATERMEISRRLGDEIKIGDGHLADIETELNSLELYFPNVPDASVPVGADETANRIEREWGEKPSFAFAPKSHWEIGEELGILDFERGTKVTGARFSFLFGAAAKMSRALMNLMLDVHERQGYTEVLSPFIVNSDSMRGTGQLPKFKEDLFRVEHERELYLIPTAEVPVTNVHRDEILDGAKLPIYYTAYTPCFRSEAGSYGKDTRGLIRQHQFEKVELVKFVAPEQSFDELEKLVHDAEEILQLLNLHYRVMTLSTGDMGFSSAKTYDIEVWLPGQETYREISSCSNFTDFQARRANIRYRTAEKKTSFVHTLNGSGLPLGRTLVAVLENYQQADGSIVVPEVLRPYMGTDRITKR